MTQPIWNPTLLPTIGDSRIEVRVPRLKRFNLLSSVMWLLFHLWCDSSTASATVSTKTSPCALESFVSQVIWDTFLGISVTTWPPLSLELEKTQFYVFLYFLLIFLGFQDSQAWSDRSSCLKHGSEWLTWWGLVETWLLFFKVKHVFERVVA